MAINSKFKGSLALAIIFSSSLYLSQGICAQEEASGLVESVGSSSLVENSVISVIDDTVSNSESDVLDTVDDDHAINDSSSHTDEANFIFDEDSKLITGYTGQETDIIVPPAINGVPVEGIDKRAFSRKGIESISLPDTVKVIGDQAFAANKELTEIELNEGLEEIGQGAFLATGETELNLPNSVKEIGRLSFANNTELEKVNFNEGLRKIGQQAFNKDEALESEVVLPSTLEHLMTSAFAGTPVDTLRVLGDENSSDLVIHSGISESLQTIKIQEAKKSVSILFNAKKDPSGKVNVDLGSIDSSSKDIESLKAFLSESIKVKYAAAYVNKNDSSGESDYYLKKDLNWDLSNVDFTKPQIKLRAVPVFEEELEEKDGFITPNVRAVSTVTEFNVVVNLMQPEWLSTDFTYETFEYKPRMKVPVNKLGISGFSEEGLNKLASNPNLEIPREVLLDLNDPDSSRMIEGILPYAFKDQSINSVSFSQIDPHSEFVIGTSAFMNNGIHSIELAEGISVIDSGAFQHNQIKELTIPSTVWKIGNSAFLDNQLSSLVISQDVHRMQLDNYSFAHNQLKDIQLPYSIFKIRDYVFRGNPGVDPVDSKYLSSEDSQDTGEVRLYTLNPDHLSTNTYIATDTPFHRIILEGEGVDREGLYQVINSSNKVDSIDSVSYTHL